MELPTLYLTYDEYIELGGELDETSYLPLALNANAYIDWYTFNRLWKEEVIPDRVKWCAYQLIKLLEAKANLLTPNVSSTGGINGNAQLKSMSNDGVSTEYAVFSADMLYDKADKAIENCINQYLNGVVGSAGRKLLYRGLYPGE